MQRSLALALLVLVSCTPETPPINRAEAPIINGLYDSGHPAVVLVTWAAHRCTGTVVTPWIVLTAAHCIAGGFGKSLVPTQVFFGSDLALGGTALPAAAAAYHPLWDPISIENDIGIVMLAQPSPVEPIPVSYLDLTDAAGQPMTIVGFGRQAPSASSAVNQKLKVTVTVQEVTSQVVRYRASVCSGDSGGPGIFEIDGKEHVVSVTSYGDFCQTYGASQRVDIHRDWLEARFAQHDRTTCLKDFRCAVGCASADPDCPCSPTDGFCSALCEDPESDPDCPRGCGPGDLCVPGPMCPAPDPDCGDPCLAEGHCLRSCPSRDPDCPVPLSDGMGCVDDFDCGPGSMCVGIPGERTCAPRCDPSVPGQCGAGTECVLMAVDAAACLPNADGESGGCQVGSTAGPGWLVLAFLSLVRWRTRRPRPRRASTAR